MLEYEDSTHTYSYNNQRYISASQIVKLFCEPFDEWAVATRYAQKHGQTAKFWINKWREKRDKATDRGNRIHDLQESILNHRMMDRINNRDVPVHNQNLFPEDGYFENLPDGVYTELKLWSHAWKVAGRADKVVFTTVGKARVADVIDHKTNERIDSISYQYSNGSFKWMKPPVSTLMDCTLSHYILQLSLYMFMLETMGFTPGKMEIIHHPHPTELDPSPKPYIISIPYMKKEVILMLNHIKRRKQHGQYVAT